MEGAERQSAIKSNAGFVVSIHLQSASVTLRRTPSPRATSMGFSMLRKHGLSASVGEIVAIA